MWEFCLPQSQDCQLTSRARDLGLDVLGQVISGTIRVSSLFPILSLYILLFRFVRCCSTGVGKHRADYPDTSPVICHVSLSLQTLAEIFASVTDLYLSI